MSIIRVPLGAEILLTPGENPYIDVNPPGGFRPLLSLYSVERDPNREKGDESHFLRRIRREVASVARGAEV